ncbi:MAG: glycosyltransferase family 2 protein [Phycisphaerales bacterium]|jgi:dolichol-phosphate mannosyltransferase|nr:glycosyltransferase family 2 protein [Phycisphaerales bacterium]
MATHPRILVGIPVFNEAAYINSVLSQVTRYANDVLIVDDGSTDLTPALLAGHPVEVIRHSENRGYGRSLQDMFRWAAVDDFDWLITMDCDEQHEPAAIPRFVDAIEEDNWDVISGSRYLQTDVNGDLPPADRRTINRALTGDLNAALGTNITDAFCGFKAYRVSSLADMAFDVDGYEFPIQFWVQAAAHGLRLREIPVRLLYVDLSRTFGGPLDDADVRLAHYREVYCRELGKHLPTARDRVPC